MRVLISSRGYGIGRTSLCSGSSNRSDGRDWTLVSHTENAGDWITDPKIRKTYYSLEYQKTFMILILNLPTKVHLSITEVVVYKRVTEETSP